MRETSPRSPSRRGRGATRRAGAGGSRLHRHPLAARGRRAAPSRRCLSESRRRRAAARLPAHSPTARASLRSRRLEAPRAARGRDRAAVPPAPPPSPNRESDRPRPAARRGQRRAFPHGQLRRPVRPQPRRGREPPHHRAAAAAWRRRVRSQAAESAARSPADCPRARRRCHTPPTRAPPPRSPRRKVVSPCATEYHYQNAPGPEGRVTTSRRRPAKARSTGCRDVPCTQRAPPKRARPGGPGHHQRAEARQGTVGTMPSLPVKTAHPALKRQGRRPGSSPAGGGPPRHGRHDAEPCRKDSGGGRRVPRRVREHRIQADACPLARSARVAAGLGRAGRLFAAARAAARAATVVGTPAGEQAATSATVGRLARTAGRLGTAGGLRGTAGRFGSGARGLGGTAGRLGGGTGRLGTGRGAVAAGGSTAAAAGSGGGVGDHQADSDGTQDGEDRGKTHHEILLIRNGTASQGIHIRTHRMRPRPAGRPRATKLRAP